MSRIVTILHFSFYFETRDECMICMIFAGWHLGANPNLPTPLSLNHSRNTMGHLTDKWLFLIGHWFDPCFSPGIMARFEQVVDKIKRLNY